MSDMSDETCETLPSEIHLTKGNIFFNIQARYWFLLTLLSYFITELDKLLKILFLEEYDELGRLQRTCNGEVAVNKCEGSCKSQVQPSVITPTGFLKVFFFIVKLLKPCILSISVNISVFLHQ